MPAGMENAPHFRLDIFSTCVETFHSDNTASEEVMEEGSAARKRPGKMAVTASILAVLIASYAFLHAQRSGKKTEPLPDRQVASSAKHDEASPQLSGTQAQVAIRVERSAKPHYSNIESFEPTTEDAAAAFSRLRPMAESGDMAAALMIYVKANECRLRQEMARRNAPNTDPAALAPPECRSLTPEAYREAAQWLERSADSGNVTAQFLYASSINGVVGPYEEWVRHPEQLEKYKRKSMAYLTANAAKGSIDAWSQLSNVYVHGVIAQKNYTYALAYYKAARLADPATFSERKINALESQMSPSEIAAANQLAERIYGRKD